MPRTTWRNATALVAFQLRFANLLRQSLQILLSSKACPTLKQKGRKPHPTMFTEDYEEWRWGQILTRQTDYNPDNQPEDENEIPQNDE